MGRRTFTNIKCEEIREFDTTCHPVCSQQFNSQKHPVTKKNQDVRVGTTENEYPTTSAERTADITQALCPAKANSKTDFGANKESNRTSPKQPQCPAPRAGTLNPEESATTQNSQLLLLPQFRSQPPRSPPAGIRGLGLGMLWAQQIWG